MSAPLAGCRQAPGTGPFFLPSCFPGTMPGPHGHLSGISRVPMEGEMPLLRPCTLAVCVVCLSSIPTGEAASPQFAAAPSPSIVIPRPGAAQPPPTFVWFQAHA